MRGLCQPQLTGAEMVRALAALLAASSNVPGLPCSHGLPFSIRRYTREPSARGLIEDWQTPCQIYEDVLCGSQRAFCHQELLLGAAFVSRT